MSDIFNNKLINYIFLIYVLFLCKDLFYKADIYTIEIKEKNNSTVHKYFNSSKFILDENYINEDKYNIFFYDKEEFYKNFSILSNYNCYDEKLKFEEQIIKCSDVVTNYFLSEYFKKYNNHYILVIDNSNHKNVYEYYKILAHYWNHRLTGINPELLNQDKQVFVLERNFVTVKFFMIKIVLVIFSYFILSFIFYIFKFKND